MRGAERRGGCIAWGIGRKGREGGAGAGSRECGRGYGNGRKGDEGVRRDTGRCGGAYSLGNRKEGAGGRRGCREPGMRERV